MLILNVCAVLQNKKKPEDLALGIGILLTYLQT